MEKIPEKVQRIGIRATRLWVTSKLLTGWACADMSASNGFKFSECAGRRLQPVDDPDCSPVISSLSLFSRTIHLIVRTCMRALALAAMTAFGLLSTGVAQAAVVEPPRVNKDRIVLDFGSYGWGVIGDEGSTFRVENQWFFFRTLPLRSIVEYVEPDVFYYTLETDDPDPDRGYSVRMGGGSSFGYYNGYFTGTELSYGALSLRSYRYDKSYELYVRDWSFAPVPVPAAAPMLLTGAAALFALRRRGSR